ncbi:MAG: hypothetical protein AAFR75_05220, partial [Pseudomonadota bacterium]
MRQTTILSALLACTFYSALSAAAQTPSAARGGTLPSEIEISPLAPAENELALANPKITWRVENPFRLFIDPADTVMHRKLAARLSLDERKSPILSAERKLSERMQDGWAAEVVDKTCWNSAQNKYVCPNADEPYAWPKSHTVLAEVTDLPDPGSVTCTWTSVPTKRLKNQDVTAPFSAPCDQAARLEVPYPDGAEIELQIGGRLIARTNAKVTDLFIVGFGDSFASGEGNPDVPVRFSSTRTATYGMTKKGPQRADLMGLPARVGSWSTIGDRAFMKNNARWHDQACHRSLYSHQLRASLQLAIEDPHRAVTYAGFACSGAEVTRGLFLRYKGNEWVPTPPDVSQISAAARLQCGDTDAPLKDLPEAYHINGKVPDLEGTVVLHKCSHKKARKIDLVFLSIGGNDIGFARLLANTILMDQSLLRRLGGW